MNNRQTHTILQAVRAAAKHVTSSSTRPTAQVLQRIAGRVPVGWVSPELVDWAVSLAPSLTPFELLLLALAIRSALSPDQRGSDANEAAIGLAADAIFKLQDLELFEFRHTLLTEALEMADVPTRMDLLYKRGNGYVAGQRFTEKGLDSALQDFGRALNLAQQERDSWMIAHATTAWVRTRRLIAELASESDDAWLAEASTLLRNARQVCSGGDECAVIAQTHAQLVRPTSPHDAVRHFNAALAEAQPASPLAVELAAEIVATLRLAGDPTGAVERGLAFLDTIPSATPPLELGLLELATGRAMVSAERWTDARPILETSLQHLAERSPRNERLCCSALIQVGLQLGDRRLAGQHIRAIRSQSEALSQSELFELEGFSAAFAELEGNPVQARKLLAASLETAEEMGQVALRRLELAELDLRLGTDVPDIEDVVQTSLSTVPLVGYERVVAGRLSAVLCNHSLRWSSETAAMVETWAMSRQHPSLAACVHARAGDANRALALLQRALASELSHDERRRCLHQLITMMGDAAHPDRPNYSDELERLLEADSSDPFARMDLAAALRADAAHDALQLARARRHAERALREIDEPRGKLHARRTLGKITLDQLRVAAPLSGESLVEWVSWLAEDDGGTWPDVAGYRLNAAELLLVAGPLTHPKVREAAAALLKTELRPEDAGPHRRLLERHAWISALAAGQAEVVVPDGADGPVDRLSTTMLQAVHGHLDALSSAEAVALREELHLAIRVRPDVADYVLRMFLDAALVADGEDQRRLLETLIDSVQFAAGVGNGTWSQLVDRLSGLSNDQQPPLVATLRQTVRRISGRPTVSSGEDDAVATSPDVKDPAQAATQLYEEGVHIMQGVQVGRHDGDAVEQIREARHRLAEAVQLGKQHGLPGLRSFLVSLGNAWRTPPEVDLQRALSHYQDARLLPPGPGDEARLDKVTADALRMRGGDDDLREADRLLARACAQRTGRWLAETLWSRAQVAELHPDLDRIARLRAASRHVVDAMRADVEFAFQGGIVAYLARRLSDWSQEDPESSEPQALRDEARALCPDVDVALEIPPARLTRREIDRLQTVLEHPALHALGSVRGRLHSPLEILNARESGPLAGSEHGAALHSALESLSLWDRPDQLEDLLSTLALNDPESRPGALVGRVLVMARLVRLGRRALADVRAATDAALEAVANIEPVVVRAHLLQELAVAWSPDAPEGDPVTDFGLAADLMTSVIDDLGGVSEADADALGYAARALRYANRSHDDLTASRRLYEAALEHARHSEGPDRVANFLHNLADVESIIGDGSQLDRHRRTVARLDEAIHIAQSPRLKAEYTASLAWEHTQVALHSPKESRIAHFKVALQTYERVDRTQLSERLERNWESNRAICLANLAQYADGHAAAVSFWRQHLARVRANGEPHLVATAEHNLADSLVRGNPTEEDVEEGLALATQALRYRTIDTNPRHYWETCLSIGGALTDLLERGRAHSLGMSPDATADKAMNWLRRASRAAKRLGNGEERLRAGLYLGRLAVLMSDPREMRDIAKQAWSHVKASAAHFLVHSELRELEAGVALRIAIRLAQMPTNARAIKNAGRSWAIDGADAGEILQWLVRAQESSQRLLRARLTRPTQMSASDWGRWRAALDSGDERRIVKTLEELRAAKVDFLTYDPPTEPLWTWLEGRPHSVAVSVILAGSGLVVGLRWVDPHGGRRQRVILVETGRATVPTSQQGHLVRSHVVPLVQSALGHIPSVVLWAPGPHLRRIAPRHVWQDTPVATATSLALSKGADLPRRARSTLLVLADPGPGQAGSLGDHGVRTLRALEAHAARSGDVRLLASVGEQHGAALLGARPEVRDTPASSIDVLEEAGAHQTIVMIAHGDVPAPESAAFVLVAQDGSLERLDVTALSESRGTFVGATVILLTCEGGLVGDRLAVPGGLAGALLAVGARVVVAPLEPVRLDVAEDVAHGVLEAAAQGIAPWDALVTDSRLSDGRGPAMGPPPSVEERDAERDAQRSSFVAWVG